MKKKEHDKTSRAYGSGYRAGYLLVGLLLLASTINTAGCALNQAEVQQVWKSVAAEYPGCTVPPKVVVLDDGTTGGRYVAATHTVYIDRYACDAVWQHEFRHACGDALGEAPVSTAVASAYPKW